jgi:4-methyl-5(b-hydroxyethyl)-thiazole monophosphate biosynthesis
MDRVGFAKTRMTDTTPSALVLLFNGFEEIEALTPIDLLSRAGVSVTQASVEPTETVSGRSGITLQTPTQLEAVASQDFDCLIIPGGPGINQLRRHPLICATLRRQHEARRILACICAAPLLLLDAGILPGPRFTCHPSAIQELPQATNQAVVRDQHCITSQGAGTAIPFALALIQQIADNTIAQSVAQAICWNEKKTA